MLVSPLSDVTGWLWAHVDIADLPPGLLPQFPPTQASAAGSTLPPEVFPPGIAGTGPAATLRFPWSGFAQHAQVGGAQWVWGTTGDLPRFPELHAALPYGNPLIALSFTSALSPDPGAFPEHNARRQSPVLLAGGTIASVSDLTVVASYPRRPGMDTLAVLRHLRSAFDIAFPEGHADRLLATSWSTFVNALTSLPVRLRLLEPSGAPVPSRTLTLQRPMGALNITLDPTHRGDVVAAAGVDRATFDAAIALDVSAGAAIAATTVSEDFPSGVVSFEPSDSHVDIAVLNEWFAPNGSSELSRFHRGNRVTPFINGPAYYADIFSELNALVASGAATENGLFYLTGYSLKHDVPLVPTSLGLTHRTVVDVTRAMANGGAEARFLGLQFLQLQPGVIETAELSAQLAGVFLSLASMLMAGVAEDGWDRANFILHTQLVSWALILGAPTVGQLPALFEANRGPLEALAAIAGVEAHLDPYIAAKADNPLGPAPGANALIDAVQALQERFGGFHQKLAIVRNDSGLIGYCGGIDLNTNRLDNRDHGIAHPYHDVHARIDGPAVVDLARTYVERWHIAGRSSLSLGAEGAMPTVPPAGTDIVQVGRTYFKPAAGGTGLPYATGGERTILDTQLAAIGKARRYIYIEEQYLTPPDEYTNALAAAANRVTGPLIIVIPDLPDQPFGLARRQQFIATMRAAWGDRFMVGIWRMPFSRAPTSVTSATGRLWLTQDVAEADNSVKVGPVDRLPSFPFWLVVGSEVMRAVRTASPTGSSTTEVELVVQRSGETRLFGAMEGTDRKSHKAKAAVTCGSFRGVYMHAKTMLIDDVFASIGSANINRRGYYSDGECNVFALRESLTHGENWIRDLRTRLWAEALGLTEEYARVALANPCAHLDLWKRKFLVGNRFTPFEAQPLLNELELKTALSSKSGVLEILGFSANILAGVADVVVGLNADVVFDTVVDPSSWVEP